MNFNKTTLSNGLRILTVPMHDNETVTAMVLVSTGSDYESKTENGISHFLEHLCFKGTIKRPTSKIINYELDAIGSISNAFTSGEYTGYYAKAHTKHAVHIVEVISDIYLNSTLPQEELEKERGVIIEELNMYEDMPQRKVWDIYGQLLYGDQATGRTTIGTKENISSFKQDDFVAYRAKHYVAEKTLVVVAGKFDEKEIISLIEKDFAHISNKKSVPKEKTIIEQKKSAIQIFTKKTDQTHLVLGFRSFDRYDKRYYAGAVLATLLGKGMSSRLFQKMREELGICYYIGASNSCSLDVGDFHISAGVGNARVEEAIKGILEEVVRIKTEKVDETELRKVKDLIQGRLFLGIESSDDLADYYGFQELYNEPILTPDEQSKKIEEVSVDDIYQVAQDIFDSSRSNLALVGPESLEKDKEKLLSLLVI